MFEEWTDKYVCDNCGYDGKGWFADIQMWGWKPMCLCDRCIEGFKAEQEDYDR